MHFNRLAVPLAQLDVSVSIAWAAEEHFKIGQRQWQNNWLCHSKAIQANYIESKQESL